MTDMTDKYNKAFWRAENLTDEVARLIAERDEARKTATSISVCETLAVQRAEKAEAEVARLRAAIKAVIDGDYPNPRDHRPGNCKHGVFYWEDCHQCIDQFLTAALATEGTP